MTREDIIAFLGEHALLRGIPDPELRIAAASIEPVSFEDGRSLLVEGDTGTDCYFIKRGSVQVSSRNLVGKTLLLAELGPGALVGEIGLLRRERRTATVTAIGDVEALRLDRRSFELLADRSPLFHESLLLTVRIRLIHRLLRKASIWADIPDAELRGLAEITTVLPMKKGDVLVREGEAADRFFMIGGGRVELRTAGRRTAQLRDGDFFGEIGLLSGTPSEATATAAEDGELLVMGKNEFQYILGYYAPVRRQFMEMLRIRAPHLRPQAESDEAPIVVTESALPKAKERWVDALLWLGGGFVLLTALALILRSDWLSFATLIVGGFVGPVTFVAYIRGHQLLGFSTLRLGLIFLSSAVVAVPLAWYLEHVSLIGAGQGDFSRFKVPLTVSVIEEGAKLLVCLALIRTKQMRFLMDAVVFGAAAGMGFAAIENVIYGWSHLGEASSMGMLSVLWIRALLSPFGHGTWTAIAAAGIWIAAAARASAAGAKPRRRSWSAALLLAAVVALHALWDLRFEGGLAKVGLMAAVGGAGIGLLYLLVRTGRKEEYRAFAALNPYVQEAVRHVEAAPDATGELRCDGCGTVSPRETRYCARCGRALRAKS
ncbi:cAMP-binding domain of CRP or a regulatory subunit of cAMP-dependent protein kinases [Cohnella sp. OV330]|uniref:cyclic nucleotide-binding domain-containing protein n=1 Tax=Cohnella sp. OV330 TaxID=1855288 RepID=UPI0008EA32FD|nr:cyclic nucleotide-binding domain-containing protein [Cohnella sp. OV330]SFA73092.1 cAMP-binding domain of CRP or a regulatory subunit of cAMP-dependent protein kinases [Cohnella sp. OV330]